MDVLRKCEEIEILCDLTVVLLSLLRYLDCGFPDSSASRASLIVFLSSCVLSSTKSRAAAPPAPPGAIRSTNCWRNEASISGEPNERAEPSTQTATDGGGAAVLSAQPRLPGAVGADGAKTAGCVLIARLGEAPAGKMVDSVTYSCIGFKTCVVCAPTLARPETLASTFTLFVRTAFRVLSSVWLKRAAHHPLERCP